MLSDFAFQGMPQGFLPPLAPSSAARDTGYSPLSLSDLKRDPRMGRLQIEGFAREIASAVDDPGFRAVHEDHQTLLTHYRLMLQQLLKTDGGLPDAAEARGLVRHLTALEQRITRMERGSPRWVAFSDLTAGLSGQQLECCGRQLVLLQLSTGCSVCCPNCGLNALTAPRRHLAWEAILEVIDRWGDYLKDNYVLFYCASDPLDWRGEQGQTYLDLLNYCLDKLGWSPSTRTAVPPGKEELFVRLWRSSHRVELSPSNVNIARLQRLGIVEGDCLENFAESLGERGNRDSQVLHSKSNHGQGLDPRANLHIPAGLHYDYTSHLPSIMCRQGVQITPDGIFNLAATAVTPLTPNGYWRAPVTPRTRLFLAAGETHYYEQLLTPYRTADLAGRVGRLPGLRAEQCLQTLYQITADTMVRLTVENGTSVQHQHDLLLHGEENWDFTEELRSDLSERWHSVPLGPAEEEALAEQWAAVQQAAAAVPTGCAGFVLPDWKEMTEADRFGQIRAAGNLLSRRLRELEIELRLKNFPTDLHRHYQKLHYQGEHWHRATNAYERAWNQRLDAAVRPAAGNAVSQLIRYLKSDARVETVLSQMLQELAVRCGRDPAHDLQGWLREAGRRLIEANNFSPLDELLRFAVITAIAVPESAPVRELEQSGDLSCVAGFFEWCQSPNAA